MTASPSASRSSDLDSGERLVVALVRGVHGLRGAVRVEVLTDHPEDRFGAGAVLHPEGSADSLTIASATPVADGPGWRLTFREVPDRTAAERLRGVYLEAVVVPAASLARGEYFWHEVIGATVRGVDGAELGQVDDLYRVGETEVMIVRGPDREFDLPVVGSLIRVFAPRRGEIVVDAAALDLGAKGPGSADDGGRPRARRSRRPRPGDGSAGMGPEAAAAVEPGGAALPPPDNDS